MIGSKCEKLRIIEGVWSSLTLWLIQPWHSNSLHLLFGRTASVHRKLGVLLAGATQDHRSLNSYILIITSVMMNMSWLICAATTSCVFSWCVAHQRPPSFFYLITGCLHMTPWTVNRSWQRQISTYPSLLFSASTIGSRLRGARTSSSAIATEPAGKVSCMSCLSQIMT